MSVERDLHRYFLTEYRELCGDYGIRIFEGEILPLAYVRYGESPEKLQEEVLKIIEQVADCKVSDMDELFRKMREELSQEEIKESPISGPSQKRREEDPLQKLARKLEGWLIIYNDS
jgi:hypothetical protein